MVERGEEDVAGFDALGEGNGGLIFIEPFAGFLVGGPNGRAGWAGA